MENLIEIEKAAKKFCRNIKKSMVYGISDIMRNSLGFGSRGGKLRSDEFWALKELSMSLKRGDVLGVIGPNGSGKSTLLKMLNGIYWPDKGKISITGRVGALIEVGAGFHPMLTGRENIYVNGAILGMSKSEIRQKFDSIVEFADIGDFLDTPVKKYSSGMFVRLGFAVAIHCDPDVLLIDEILAVGDMSFRRKCYNMIDRLRGKCVVVLVSHNMFQIGRICDRVLFLNQGETRFLGSAEQGILEYYKSVKENESGEDKVQKSEGGIRLERFEYRLKGDRLEMDFFITKNHDLHDMPYILSITFTDSSENLFAQVNSLFSDTIFKKPGKITCTIPALNFNHGLYRANLMIYDARHSHYYSMYRNLFDFKVTQNFVAGTPVHFHNAEWKH